MSAPPLDAPMLGGNRLRRSQRSASTFGRFSPAVSIAADCTIHSRVTGEVHSRSSGGMSGALGKRLVLDGVFALLASTFSLNFVFITDTL